MSVFPFGGPVVELGGSTPCRPSVLLAGAYCGAVRPGLRISAVSPAGLGFELDPSQTRTEAENQIPAVRGLGRRGLHYRGLDLIAMMLRQLQSVLHPGDLALDAVHLFLHPS